MATRARVFLQAVKTSPNDLGHKNLLDVFSLLEICGSSENTVHKLAPGKLSVSLSNDSTFTFRSSPEYASPEQSYSSKE